MTANVLIIRDRQGSQELELARRLPGLLALYQPCCSVELDRYSFGVDVRDFIGRGGQVHYVIEPDGPDRLLGFATLMTSRTVLENIFPVDRFIIDTAASRYLRQVAAMQLLDSITNQAEAELSHRHDDVCVQVSFPAGADSLEANQPIYTELELNGFQASRTPGMVVWTRWIQRVHSAVSKAA